MAQDALKQLVETQGGVSTTVSAIADRAASIMRVRRDPAKEEARRHMR